MSPGPDAAFRHAANTEAAGRRSRAVRDLARRLRSARATLALVTLLALASAVASVVVPVLLGRATDVVVRGAGPSAAIDLERLRGLLLMAVLVIVVGAAAAYISQLLITRVVQTTVHQLRSDVEEKLHRLPLQHVDEQARGDLLSRVTNDVDNVAQSLQQTLGQLLASLLTMVGTVAVMLVVSPLLFAVVLGTVPLTIVLLRVLARRSQRLFADQWSRTGVLNAQVEEACSGHALLAAFGAEQQAEVQFRKTNELVHDASFGAQVVAGLMQPLTMLCGNLTLVSLAVVGGVRVAAGAMTVGTVQAFLQYSRQLTMPLSHVASMASMLQSGIASAERVLEVLEGPDETPDHPEREEAGRVRGRVCFEHVSFAYRPDRPLLDDVTFVAEPGQTLAIVGPTGAGKTTLVNLLLRFYDVSGGRITVDDHDIRELTRSRLRSSIGMVLQDTWLFHGTIRDNILYGDPAADEASFLRAAKAAYVDRFVHALPDGYETVVDESAANLSAGEKQLITIARAFLADPPILVLDEATSSVDTRTEVLVQRAMAALRRDRTCFVIAHRLSTIRDAASILVIVDGRIVEHGDHATLLAQPDGMYASLHAAQSPTAPGAVSRSA